MDTERAKRILADAGIEHSDFASKLGIKPGSLRMNLSMGRLSKKAVAMLLELEADLKEEKKDEPSEAAIVKEGMIRQTLGEPLEKLAKVYMLPKNPYLRLVEFKDGTHGKFKAQPGKFGLGAIVKLAHEQGDMYRLVGRYDRKDRLV